MKNMQANSLVTIMSLFVTSVAVAAPELKGTPDELKQYLQPTVRTISIAGVAKEVAYSDQAHVTLIVTTEEKTLTLSLQKNVGTRQSLTNELVSAGIPAAKINNSQFSSSPQYGWFGRKPSEYQVVNRLKVTIVSEAQLTLLSKVADEREEVVVGNIEFEHSKKKELESKVRDAALDEAMAKSSSYGEKLGLVLVPVAFNFYDVEPRRRHSAAIEEVVVTAHQKRGVLASTSQPKPPAPVTFDEIEYNARVNVIFELRTP